MMSPRFRFLLRIVQRMVCIWYVRMLIYLNVSFLSEVYHLSVTLVLFSVFTSKYLFSSWGILALQNRSPRCTSGSPRMPLLIVLIREFESRRDEILNLLAKIWKRSNCWERLAWVSTIRRESTREERAEIFSRKKCKARTVVGRGGEEPATWPRIWVTRRRERA